MIHLDYRDSRPIYEQVKDGFRQRIIQEIIQKDEKLPSVRELATALTINPNTIQRAYRELEQEGYVYTVPGKGSFVAGIPDSQGARVKELWDEIEQGILELQYLGMDREEILQRVDHILNSKTKGRQE